MPHQQARRWLGGLMLLMIPAPAALPYIHFPPMTLQKMCQVSHHIHVLKVEKFSKDKGVILFAPVAIFKGRNSQYETTKHVLQAGAEGSAPILDWLAEGKTAVMFYIEGSGLGCGYVFIDR